MPPELMLPDMTTIMFEPRLLIWSAIRAWAPAPIAPDAMNAPTPIMMPSMASVVRMTLARSARRATWMVARGLIARHTSRARLSGEPRHGWWLRSGIYRVLSKSSRISARRAR